MDSVIVGSKSAANEADPKRGRPSKKGASNRTVTAESVYESAVIGQITKEVVAGSSRPEIEEGAEESVHVEEVVPQNQIEVHTTLRVKTEMHVNEDVMQSRKDESFISPRKFFHIGKKRRANHRSSLFNFINIQHKQSHPQQKLSTVRLELSQQWKDLPLEEKQKYVPEANPLEDNVGTEDFVDLFSINCRCSPERFKNLVSGFSDEQKAACKAFGFGVLLEIAGKRLRKSTVSYLVECVDPAECTIKIHGKTLEISPNDFSRVMGLKNSGKEVEFVGPIKDNPDLMSIVQEFSTKEGKSMMVLKDVENYLKNKEAPVDEKFKRLFVLYTMCTILTPSASLMIPQKWMLPLRDTSLIRTYNWSEHAFKYLMKGISEFQKIPQDTQTSNNPQGRQIYINGCVLFLQLFYFDCVVAPNHYVDRSMYPVEAWGDTQADKVMAYTKSKGGLMSAQIEACKPVDRVYGRSEAIDEGLSHRVAILEESFKEYKAQTSEKLGMILSVLEKMVSKNVNSGKDATVANLLHLHLHLPEMLQTRR
ncbi:hypothetical protein ACLB2K_022489 [Fragaria x ananassa]